MTEAQSAYSTDHSSGVLRTHSWRNVANSAAYLTPHLKPGLRVLDIGCGPGSLTIDLAKHTPDGQVIGIDYVPDPLDQARLAATQAGVNNVEFEVGDIHSLDFPDDTFDIVHAHQVLQHISDPIKALQEMRRVAKPGGIVAIRESAAMTWYPESPGIGAWRDLVGRVMRGRGANPDPGNRLQKWACDAGFERRNITCSTGSWCFSSPEERAYWGGSMAERVLSSGFSKNALEGGYSSPVILEGIAQGWRDFVEDENAWFSVLHGQAICVV